MKKVAKITLPLVSVVMPVYNAGSYLVPAIESILSQTYTNFEFIIVDDASSDGSWETIRAYQKHYPDRIIAIRLRKNLNAGGDICANIGLAAARGKYIARMDADDIADPTRLTKQVTYLETHPKTFLVGSQATVINDAGERLGEKRVPRHFGEMRQQFFSVHPLIHPTCMFRRLVTPTEPFRYTIKFNANNDYYSFFLLLCRGYRFANLPEKLLYYRIHKGSATYKNLKGNFRNTVKIRLEMVRAHGYPVSFRNFLILIAQSAIVAVTPSVFLTTLYLTLRGFHTLRIPLLPLSIPSLLFLPVYKLNGKK